MKIAIMMLVHKNKKQVQRLIDHLSNDFDVFVHIDKRCNLTINKSDNVFVYTEYKTYWGSFNQIIATLFLLKKAFEKGYDRYILISGQDLPIKTNEEIKEFFINNNREYVDIAKIPTSNGWPNMNRLIFYNIYNDSRKKLYRLIKHLLRLISKCFPRKLEYEFYGGSNWTNYTHICVEKIFKYLDNDRKYVKRYKWTTCADEIFYQTILASVEGLVIENNCLRYVDWQEGTVNQGTPKILREADYEKIINSGGGGDIRA